MKLKFAGVGSAFCSQDQYQTNAVLVSDSECVRPNLLIDCGSDARFSLKELGVDVSNIGGVYVSHLHADHVGGMEWLAFCSYFTPNLERPQLFCDHSLMREMWESTLKGGLDSVEGKIMTLTDYFNCCPVFANKSFAWDSAELTPIQTVHIMAGYNIVHSFGLMIEYLVPSGNDWEAIDKAGPRKVFYTADTQFAPNQIKAFYNEADLIFHDCETAPYYSGVHAHYDDLKTLPDDTRKKMWLMHYQPIKPIEEMQKIAQDDGFAGFVVKGQEFDLDAVVPEKHKTLS